MNTKRPEEQIVKQAGICPPLNWQQYKEMLDLLQVTGLSCSNQLFPESGGFAYHGISQTSSQAYQNFNHVKLCHDR